MEERLESIHIENFKSLKKFDIELGRFNVLIGSNGSGKTNVLEFFKFVNLCINPRRDPPYPFTPWWGFNNIVYLGREDLPISFEMKYTVLNKEMKYLASISGSAGKFSFLAEKFSVSDLLRIERDYSSIEYHFEKEFLEKNKEIIQEAGNHPHINTEELFSPKVHDIPVFRSLLKHHSGWSAVHSKDMKVCFGQFNVSDNLQNRNIVPFISPIVTQNNIPNPLLPSVQDFLTNSRIIFLRQLNLDLIRQPSPIGNSGSLGEDGKGLVNILFNWYTQKGGRLPHLISTALEELFPNWQITFKVTDDGRIMLNIVDGELALSPTSIPDGFYKLLAILTAIELKPSILLIDEVETSLHAKIIEYLISLFKTVAPTTIVTTHSPLVIDLVDLEDLILLERIGFDTNVHKIQDPQEMREHLVEKGITPSESWLYAKL